jgi:hypothetical protein
MNLAHTETIGEARHERALAHYSRVLEQIEAYNEAHEQLAQIEYKRLCKAPTGLDMQCAAEYWAQAEGTVLSCAWAGDEANRDERLGFAARTLLETAFAKMADVKADELLTAAMKAVEHEGLTIRPECRRVLVAAEGGVL